MSNTHRIEAAINAMDGRLWVRNAAQAHNGPADDERLRDAFRAGHSKPM